MDAEQLDKFDECRRGCCFLWLFDGEVRFTFLVDCQKEFFFLEDRRNLIFVEHLPGPRISLGSVFISISFKPSPPSR